MMFTIVPTRVRELCQVTADTMPREIFIIITKSVTKNLVLTLRTLFDVKH